MTYPAYRVEYLLRWPGKKSSLYGYTQVVSKSSGKRYVYHRDGVLSRHPFIKDSRNSVIIPDSALQPLISFLKTGQNPAHRFTDVANWTDIVKYTVQETAVSDEDAANAVYSAISRLFVRTLTGSRPAISLLDSVDVLSPDEVYSLYYAIAPIYRSRWYSAFRSIPDFSELANKLDLLASRVSTTL